MTIYIWLHLTYVHMYTNSKIYIPIPIPINVPDRTGIFEPDKKTLLFVIKKINRSRRCIIHYREHFFQFLTKSDEGIFSRH